mmetsp:Transcript_36415/g.104076  ORF Transcript_36415/g.104076 Transcript_36415/m.104076 type:complete len:322 (-) Transcript_36415:1201-2166(-)
MPTSLHSELSPVPPSLAIQFSPLSDSSRSDSGPPGAGGSAESGSSMKWPAARTRRTSESVSIFAILIAAVTRGTICPRRPAFRTCGNIVEAQQSRTFFTGSAASRSSGRRSRSVKTRGGVSRMTESHMRTYVMRLRKDLLRANVEIRCRTSLPVLGGSRVSKQPDSTSPVPLTPGSTNSSGAAARSTRAVPRAASSRTSATPSVQSCRNNGTMTDQVMSLACAGCSRVAMAMSALPESAEAGSSSPSSWSSLPPSPGVAPSASQTAPSCEAARCRSRQLSAFDMAPCSAFERRRCGPSFGAARRTFATLRKAANRTSWAAS